MRLFCLEVKRVLKSRRTLILLAVALILSVAMAYLPVAFESINRVNPDGSRTELDGIAAIEFKRDLYASVNGEVTPEKVSEALKTYQSLVNEYGPTEGDSFPLSVYIEQIVPIRPLLRGLPELYADPLTGIGADLMDIAPEDVVQNYYELCKTHLADVMRNEQRDHPAAQQQAMEQYAEVDTPFQIYPGLSRDAFDYIELYILVLTVLCVAIASPTFSGEYQTGSDSILRCTKNGRIRLAITKIAASFVIFIVSFAIGMTLHLLICNLSFGMDCLKSSMQMLFSIINLSNINLGQLQILIVLAGLLSILSCVSCTLFLSAKCRDSLTVLLISIAIVLIPFFAYAALGVNWISALLPSAGIGMQNNFLYQLINFNYLHIGKMSFWTPYIILISAAVEVPIFLFLAIRSYCNHQVV
ncbi:ABC transporter permease subunit [Lachnospiraceae bacterium SGI.066]|nr:ABC transporter permease subunit [Oscillospiraceae bacterium]